MDDLTHPAHSYLLSLFRRFAAKMQAEIVREVLEGSGAGALRKHR